METIYGSDRRHRQVVALGNPDAAGIFGYLACTNVKTVLKAGSEYHRIDVVVDRYRDETMKQSKVRPEKQ